MCCQTNEQNMFLTSNKSQCAGPSKNRDCCERPQWYACNIWGFLPVRTSWILSQYDCNIQLQNTNAKRNCKTPCAKHERISSCKAKFSTHSLQNMIANHNCSTPLQYLVAKHRCDTLNNIEHVCETLLQITFARHICKIQSHHTFTQHICNDVSQDISWK